MSRSLTNQAGTRSETTTDVWLTPPNIIQTLGTFDLDPCAACNRPWDTAQNHYCVHDDGLRQRWEGFVWCNPPYGREIAMWLNKMARHGNGIALIFARTDTKAFQKYVLHGADSILFLAGRIKFYRPDGISSGNSAGAPSCLVAYGKQAVNRLENSGLQGKHVLLHY